MRPLPSGTVTFLFSDIEGSTRLLDELGADRYADTLAEHRRLIREAFTAHGGVEVDTQGDAFFVAFASAKGAVVAAAEAQAALAQGPVRVRMGIHSGEPLLTEEGYVGIDVHQGARVMSAGHGGQVLVSQTTQALVAPDFTLRDLGRHRLKDLTEAQPLYQLGEGEFPPPKTISQTNLPVQPTPLVGRETELAEVLALLSESRLVTLTGAGGSGKTRLALQAAAEVVEDYPQGVWWVSLAALRDPALVESTIAQVVGSKNGLAEHLRAQQTLLLLDNFEQVVGAAPQIADLLANASGLRILATSRERLALSAEQEYPVPTLAPREGVALFTVRARQLKPGFEPDEHVEKICRRLDGLPLALELAAARVKVLSPERMLERLGHSFGLLTTGSRDTAERHKTLWATIEWSYELLDVEERKLFAVLAVFAGSFELDAAEAICDASLDALAALVDKSLLLQTEQGRFFMLKTIHEYAAELLEASGIRSELEGRHTHYYLQRAEAAEPELRAGDLRWLNSLEEDHDNFRAALERLLARNDVAGALRLAGALCFFWWVHGHVGEGRRWVQTGLDRDADVDPQVRATALDGASYFALLQGDVAPAKSYAEESLQLWRAIGDPEGVMRALIELASVAAAEGDYERAKLLYRESGEVAQDSNQLRGLAVAANNLAYIALLQREYDEAAELCDEGLQRSREVSFAVGTTLAEMQRGWADLGRGRYDEAREWFGAALAGCRELGFTDAASDALEGVAAISLAARQIEDAVRLVGAVAALRRTSSSRGFDEGLSDRVLVAARAELGHEDSETLFAEGRAMTLEDAIDLGLGAIR